MTNKSTVTVNYHTPKFFSSWRITDNSTKDSKHTVIIILHMLFHFEYVVYLWHIIYIFFTFITI